MDFAEKDKRQVSEGKWGGLYLPYDRMNPGPNEEGYLRDEMERPPTLTKSRYLHREAYYWSRIRPLQRPLHMAIAWLDDHVGP